MSFKVFIFSYGSHFVQRGRTILAILVEGHIRKNSVKQFSNRADGVGWHVV